VFVALKFTMESHELDKVKAPHVAIANGNGNGHHVPTYTGDRTNGTKNTATRVRRLFSFAQIFFFALSYMSSWEAVCVSAFA
jgi:choline transport protein